MKIGFIGLGNIDGKLAGSLLRNNFNLIVRDIDSKLTKKFSDQGVLVVNSSEDLAEKGHQI